RVTATIENVGTGTMPLELVAIRGVRFPELGEETDADTVPEPYRESRTAITLAAGESTTVEILTDFEPGTLIVDPDAIVLQLRREFAEAELSTD
ncbi:MAG: hypothetical protein IID31_07050, partial [Planctomycetes bacterium]|nr:hypothetical protein [Planctomycetota bacterium]